MNTHKSTIIALSIGVVIALVFGGFLTWTKMAASDVATTDNTTAKKIAPTADPAVTEVVATPVTQTSTVSEAAANELTALDKDISALETDTTEGEGLTDSSLGI